MGRKIDVNVQTYRTMKQKIIFLMCMVLSFTGVNAQNKDAIDQKANRDKKIERLNEEIGILKAKNEKLDSTLRAERRDGKATKYKQQIKQLRQDSVACKKQMDALVAQSKKDSLAITSLQNKLNELQVFRVKWLTQLAESVDEKWLSKPYSAIDVKELETDFKQYEEFASADERVANARDKLQVLLANSQLYWKVFDVVNSEYDAEVVDSLIEPMRYLRDNVEDADNKSDIATLFEKLDNYSIIVEIFQDVIRVVDKEMIGQSKQQAALPLANAILEKQEEESKAIQEIPWLAKKYKEYLNALEKDCLEPNSIGIAILNLKTSE